MDTNEVNIDPQLIEQASRDADMLVRQIQASGDLEPAYAALDAGLSQFEESGFPLEALLPADSEAGAGFAAAARDGRGFWQRYREAVRKSLCDKDGELGMVVRPVIQGENSLRKILFLKDVTRDSMQPFSSLLHGEDIVAKV